MTVEEKQRRESIEVEKLRQYTMSGLHDAFNVIRDEVGDSKIKQWLANER